MDFPRKFPRRTCCYIARVRASEWIQEKRQKGSCDPTLDFYCPVCYYGRVSSSSNPDWHGVWLLVATPIARRQDRPEEAKDMPALPLTVLMLARIPKKGMSYAL